MKFVKILFICTAILTVSCTNQLRISGLPKASICQSNNVSIPRPQNKSVFNIPLGGKFSLMECDRKSYGYSIGASHLCFERLWGNEKEALAVCNETVKIRFPVTESPQIVSGAELLGLIMDGKLEGIGFNTCGYLCQNTVLDKLKNKYGEPEIVFPRTMRNGFGVLFESFLASWNTEGVAVTFYGIHGGMNTGLVTIDTKKGREYRAEKLKELTKDPNSL